MTEVLLKELSNSDINWMTAIGHKQEVAAGNVLIQQQSNIDAFYIVLSGTLTATTSRDKKSALGRAFAALENDNDLEQEVARFSSGEVIGEMSFLNISPSATTVRAQEESVVLVVPHQELLTKLRQDLGFASRFYRAIAILLLDRFEGLVRQFIRSKRLQVQPLQDGPLIFGELSDSDVDWMSEHGHLEEIAASTLLVRSGRPVESLFVLLQGTLSASFSEDKRSALTRVFATLENDKQTDEPPGLEIARTSRGEIIGEMALIDSRLPKMTVRALEDSLVLAMPRQQLIIKLQQDQGFASRFYRVVAVLLSGRIQGLISRLGYGKGTYQIGQRLSRDIEYEDEIDLKVMDNITLGGARFDWMLRRLRVGGTR